MKPKRSGWMEQSAWRGRLPKVESIEPAKFDLLLASLGIGEDIAASHPKAIKWVREHYRSRFVPERILDAIMPNRWRES